MTSHRTGLPVQRGTATLVGALAVAVIVGQLVWRAVLLSRGYYGQDDFVVLDDVSRSNLADLLTDPYLGGFAPGAQLLAWAQVQLAPLGWGLSASVVLVAETAATALLWLALGRILPGRWIRLALLVWFAYAPLTLWATQWWAYSAPFWCAAAAVFAAAWVLRMAVDGAGRWTVATVPLLVAVALLCNDRLLWSPIALLAVAAAGRSGGMWIRLTAAVRDAPLLWLGTAAVVAAFTALHITTVPVALPGTEQLGDTVTTLLRHTVSQLAGGPWTAPEGHALLMPRSWAVAGGGLVLLAVVAVTLQRGGAGARAAWACFVAALLVLLGLVALQGGGVLFASYGLAHRFAADAAILVVLVVGVALRDVGIVPGPGSKIAARLPRLSLEAAVAVGASVILTVSCAVSTRVLAPALHHGAARTYVENVRAGLREEPRAVLLDGSVPSAVMNPLFGSRATRSVVVGAAPEHPIFDVPSEVLRVPRDDGRLVPVALDGPVAMTASDDTTCGYHVTAGGVTVPLGSGVPGGRWLLRLGYYTNVDSFATLHAGDSTAHFGVHEGLHTIDVVVRGPFAAFSVALDEPVGTVCLTDAAVGLPVPSESGGGTAP